MSERVTEGLDDTAPASAPSLSGESDAAHAVTAHAMLAHTLAESDGRAAKSDGRVEGAADGPATEDRFRTLFEQAPFAIQIFAPDGRSLQVNAAYKELWGMSDAQLASFNVLTDKTLLATELMPYIRRAFAGERTVLPAYRFGEPLVPVGPDVPDRWIRESYFPVTNASGALSEVIVIFIVIFEDITDQKLAALEERQRLARELHDSVSQALYGIALGARTARTLLDRDAARAVEPLEYVLSLAEAGLAEMRALIFDLLPTALETEGIVAALEKQAAATRARYGISIETALAKEPQAPLAVKEALYRIAQESLHNTVKHARARTAAIRLEREASGLRLTLEDDGVGFDPTGSFPGHLGLQTMRERATLLGGTLELESAPGCGARIQAWLPCPVA